MTRSTIAAASAALLLAAPAVAVAKKPAVGFSTCGICSKGTSPVHPESGRDASRGKSPCPPARRGSWPMSCQPVEPSPSA